MGSPKPLAGGKGWFHLYLCQQDLQGIQWLVPPLFVPTGFRETTMVCSAFFVPIVFGGNTEVGSSFIGVSAGFKGNTKVG